MTNRVGIVRLFLKSLELADNEVTDEKCSEGARRARATEARERREETAPDKPAPKPTEPEDARITRRRENYAQSGERIRALQDEVNAARAMKPDKDLDAADIDRNLRGLLRQLTSEIGNHQSNKFLLDNAIKIVAEEKDRLERVRLAAEAAVETNRTEAQRVAEAIASGPRSSKPSDDAPLGERFDWHLRGGLSSEQLPDKYITHEHLIAAGHEVQREIDKHTESVYTRTKAAQKEAKQQYDEASRQVAIAHNKSASALYENHPEWTQTKTQLQDVVNRSNEIEGKLYGDKSHTLGYAEKERMREQIHDLGNQWNSLYASKTAIESKIDDDLKKMVDSAEKSRNQAMKKLEVAKDTLQNSYGTAVREVLNKIRPLGAQGQHYSTENHWNSVHEEKDCIPTNLWNKLSTDKSKKEGKAAVEDALRSYPANWGKSMQDRGCSIAVRLVPGVRAFQKDLGPVSALLLSGDKSTTLHEIGHSMEAFSRSQDIRAREGRNNAPQHGDNYSPAQAVDRSLWQRVNSFYESRTAGKPREKMKDLYPSANYKDHEIVCQDDFAHPYIGKEYLDGSGKRVATEIMAMGIQAVYDKTRPADPGHKAFTLGALAWAGV